MSSRFLRNSGKMRTLPTPGQIAPNMSSVSCEPCPIGTYSEMFGATECSDIQPGHFAADDETNVNPNPDVVVIGAWQMISCPSGTHKIESGHGDCQECEIGRTNPDEMANKLLQMYTRTWDRFYWFFDVSLSAVPAGDICASPGALV